MDYTIYETPIVEVQMVSDSMTWDQVCPILWPTGDCVIEEENIPWPQTWNEDAVEMATAMYEEYTSVYGTNLTAEQYSTLDDMMFEILDMQLIESFTFGDELTTYENTTVNQIDTTGITND